MRGRHSSVDVSSFSFGPGPITPAIKILIAANVVVFLVDAIVPADPTLPISVLQYVFGLKPQAVFEQLRIWQPVTYMFLHGGIGHLLFNMLALWMFGVELERMWGTRFFAKFYVIAGLGAAAATMILGLIFGGVLYSIPTIGASGAIYGVLLAYALYFPHRPILLFLLFPIPAKYFVMIIGAISLYSSMNGPGGVAHVAHLGGLVTAYFYLKGTRLHLLSEIQYRFLKWRMNRMRRKFDVYHGGRANDVDRRVH
jgi:membrane associated rhomboid family serine protease